MAVFVYKFGDLLPGTYPVRVSTAFRRPASLEPESEGEPLAERHAPPARDRMTQWTSSCGNEKV